jgi:hypothetical protein
LGKEQNGKDRVLEALMNEIGDGLSPVRPLKPPWIRAGSMSLSWLLLLALTLGIFGLRRDYGELGPLASWGVSALQWFVAYGIAWSGLRLAVPGDLTPGSFRAVLLLGGFALHFIGATLAFRVSPSWVEPGQELRMVVICFLFISLLAALPLILALRLAAEGLVSESVHAGLLLGLSAGLAAEGAWRMHCPYTSWEHIVTGHSSAVAAAALVGLFWFRRRFGR